MRPQPYATMPLTVTAVQLTVENLESTAEWCKGSVRGVLIPAQDRCIAFNFKDEEQHANVGDWIVSYSPTEFFPYPDKLFHERFFSY